MVCAHQKRIKLFAQADYIQRIQIDPNLSGAMQIERWDCNECAVFTSIASFAQVENFNSSGKFAWHIDGLPSNTIKPLQMIQNAAARLVFNEPKRTHVTPLFISLHWLPVAARIKFKTLMLAYRTTTGSAPSYFHSLLRICIPSRSLRSASERRLVVPSQRGSKSLSRTFSFTIPGWWNNLPTPIRNAGSLSIFKQQLKTYLFRHYLTSS